MKESELDEHVDNILMLTDVENPKEKIKRYLKATIIAQLEHHEAWIKEFKERREL